jgi:glycosyltransferase involved in cell wall biosynthesis
MPTRDRRPFVAQSIRYFLRQDYPDLELIIVDDGTDPVANLVPDDPRIRYLHTGAARSVGAKRNIACELARGELIAHWDDDDWMAPHRVRRQVEALAAAGADVCGLADLLYYRPLAGDGWRYRGGAGAGRVQLAGCSVVYRRAVWVEHGFMDVSVGEDGAFVAALPPERVHALPDPSLMVGVLHGGNVAPKPLGSRQWQPAELTEIAELLSADRAFYAALRAGWRTTAARPVPRRTGISVAAPFEVHSGYGSMAEYLVLGLARTGVPVHPLPLGLRPDGLTDELRELLRTATGAPEPGMPLVFHSALDGPDPYRWGPDVYLSTMWEADLFPPSWVPRLQRARAVIVPSTFVADACRASGVSAPVVVVPQGADPDVYHWQQRPEREGLTTLVVAPVDRRKHTRRAIAAWQQAFADDPHARLVIKTAYGYHNYTPDDPRISYVDRVESTRGIAHWYREADVLLALGNEGFGLPLVEGMATGLPVIALDAEGQADVCRDAAGLLLPVPRAGMEPHSEHLPGAIGSRSVPDVDVVVRQLRWVDEHRAEAAAMGAAAAEWVAGNRNVWSVGPAVLDVIENTPPRRTLRCGRRGFWVPSAGTACGVAEYAARMRLAMPGTALSATEPDTPAGSVVHVQHEPGILDDGRLGRFVQRAKDDGATVAVTEHSVHPHPSPWEERVDALVAATAEGARRLRERCPGVRVEHIPLGCDAWFPPRKHDRGRTLAFFGFPGPHKGLAALAGALAALPGCELLVFSHAGPDAAAILPGWPHPARVRWVRDWLPLPQLAARLAAEADALVFWYDQVPHASASSAALVGLASGVPVLTSATTWFADLGPAVYRPANLVEGIERLLADDGLRDEVTRGARDHCDRHRWSRIAARHVALWNSLVNC